MRAPFVALSLAVLVVIVATALLSPAREPHDGEGTAGAATLAAGQFNATVTSFDHTLIAITVFHPEGASEAAPVPVVLHSHGWSGARADSPDDFAQIRPLLDAGFGVVSIDARGHGASGGYAMVHHKDHEVKDFQAVLDWIHDNLPWAQREPDTGIPKDLVVGASAYSYGGAFQLMTASYDKRLDAIVPEITWNYLPDALAPDGVVKSVWVHFLYGTAKESGTRIDPRIDEWYREAMLLNTFPQEAHEHFVGSSPLVDSIEADVLLIQGIPDVLFNLNHALWTYDALESKGTADVRLFTHLSGHVLPGIQPLGTMEPRRAPFEDVTPCGTLSELVVRWMDEKLRGGAPSGIPEISYALDDGECLRLDARDTALHEADVGTLAVPTGAGSAPYPLLEGPGVIAGAPRLTGATLAAAAEGRAFASLVIVDAQGQSRVVDDQARPFRYAPGATLDVEMVAVAARLHEGDRLFLRIDGANEWFFTNSPRTAGAALLENVKVTLPMVGAA